MNIYKGLLFLDGFNDFFFTSDEHDQFEGERLVDRRHPGGQRVLVAIAGAHGKTTSTAMIVTALLALGADPSFVNGGVIRSLGVSAARGSGELFVVEADESDGSFLLYDTAVALITNVDPDHLDHFGSEDAFEAAFVAFAENASELVVISSDDRRAASLAGRHAARRFARVPQRRRRQTRNHEAARHRR